MITITKRSKGVLDGVKDVILFAPEEVLLSTEDGLLKIVGKELHVISLNVEKGLLEFQGHIDSMAYSEEKTPGKVVSKIFKRMFK